MTRHNVPAMHVAIQAVIPELKVVLRLRELCVRQQGTGVSTGWTCPQLPRRTVFICFSLERALNVKVKHGAQPHAQHIRNVHGGYLFVFSH